MALSAESTPAPAGPLKTWTFIPNGQPADILTLKQGRPLPSLPPNPIPKHALPHQPEQWLRIKVSHSSLNPAGIYNMLLIPRLARGQGWRSEMCPEMDCVGTVEESAFSTSSGAATELRITPGDRVWVHMPFGFCLSSGVGALASHIVVPERFATRLPPAVDAVQAAGLGVATFTAWAAVAEAGLREGARVLVPAVAGGIGSQAVQMVRERIGPTGFIVGVCKGAAEEKVKELGVNETVDYEKHPDVAAELIRRYGAEEETKFDAVVDCLGFQELYLKSRFFTKEGVQYTAVGVRPQRSYRLGSTLWTLVVMAMNAIWPLSPWLRGTGRKWKVIAEHDPTTEEREELIKKLEAGKFKVLVDSVWSYKNVLAAYGVILGGKAAGKVVVRWDEE